MTETEVIIVGAGPTGLMLAYELQLAGVPVAVLERLTEPDPQSKAGAVQPRTAEMLDLRGLLDPLLAEYPEAGQFAGGHFAALPVPLECSSWQTRYPTPLRLWQRYLQDLLERRLASGTVLRGAEVTAVEQDERTVTATTTRGTVTGSYLVACDGGHSTVRKLLNAAFPGEPPSMAGSVADIELVDATTVPSVGHMSQLMRHGEDHWGMLLPVDDGLHRLVFGRLSDNPTAERPTTPVSEDEVRAALLAVYGEDVRLVGLRAGSRFGDATRQVQRYRHGRVFFAGDAAHIHSPAGGQGLNLGVQDALNLGWKLATELRGGTPDGLLDTYHDERHPVAAAVLQNTLAQRVLMNPRPDPQHTALREVFVELIRLPQANQHLAGAISGLAIQYQLAGPPHPLLGRRMPDLDLVIDGTPRRLCELLHSGRGAVVEFGEAAAFDEAAVGGQSGAYLTGRVTHQLAKTTDEPGALAVLLRPDGYVAWAGDDPAAPGLPEAIRRWFG